MAKGVTMILFLDDWKKYPDAIIHKSTSNRSFVHLVGLYKAMGVKNHAFILALHNPELEFIDPFSPNLTLQQKAMIAVECQENPWYFFREIARVPIDGSDEPVMFQANRGNIALFFSFFNHIMIFLIQTRQTGKSVSTDVLMTLLMNVLCQNTSINLLTKDDKLRRKNIERLKGIADGLPNYISRKTKEDASNVEEITVKAMGNTYKTHVPQQSPKAAGNIGRGLTSGIFHIDEPAFQANIAIALAAALPATGAAFDAAKAAGTPHGVIFTTTAGKLDDPDGAFIYSMVSDAATWTERFLDARDEEDLERMVTQASRGGVCRINATFSHRQLGKTDDWLKKKIQASTQTGDAIKRDYYNIWTSGTASHPLADIPGILDAIVDSFKPVEYTDISTPHGYITKWYIPEHEVHERMSEGKFIMGMDTSEASGGDDISLYIVDVETFETVCTGKYNRTSLHTFNEWVCSILVTYPNVTAVIERKNSGVNLIDTLLQLLPSYGIDPFKRIFNWGVNDYQEFRTRYEEEINIPMGRRSADIYMRYKKLFGFATSGSGPQARTELYGSTLREAAKNSATKIYDGDLITQINGLTTRNGRIDHEHGKHDDMVVGWLLAHWFLTHAKNLSFYGIDSRKVGSLANINEQESDADVYERQYQEHLRDQMDILLDRYNKEHDQFVSQKLEQEMRVLDRQLVRQRGETFSLDEIIRKAKENKAGKKRAYDGNRGSGLGYGNYYQPPTQFSDRPMTTREMLAMF
jgi:hypothetical protein